MLVNLNQVLKRAQENHYAVGLFNTTDTDMLQAAVEAAEETRSPIIIGTAEVLLPYGALELIAPALINCAERRLCPWRCIMTMGLHLKDVLRRLSWAFPALCLTARLRSMKRI